MKKRLALVAALAAAGLMLAGCSSGGSSAPASTAASGGTAGALPTDPISINLGLIPFAELAPVMIAQQKGWFTDAGITLNVTMASAGATIIQAMAAGQIDIGYVNSVSAVQAISNGLPLVAFRDNDTQTTQGVYALKSGPIKTAKDLEGKTIAVSGLKGLADLTSQAPLEADGVDWSKVKLVQIAPADQEQALATGQVDAVWFSEPYRTLADQHLGLTLISKMLQGPTEGMATAMWVANATYWQQHADNVKRFNAVLGRAMHYAIDNPSEVAAILPTYTSLTPDLAPLVKPAWVPDRDLHQSVAPLNDLMVKYDYISSPIDLDTTIVDAN